MKNTFYVYFLISSDTPYYVGMSKRPEKRYYRTQKQKDLCVVESFDTMEDALSSEIFWMEQLRQWGFQLTNKKDYSYNKRVEKKRKVKKNVTFFKVGEVVFDQNWMMHQVRVHKYWKHIQFEGKQYGLSTMTDMTGYSEQIRVFNEPTMLIKTYVPESKHKEISRKIKDILREYEIYPKDEVLYNRKIYLDSIVEEDIKQDRILRSKDRVRKSKLLQLIKSIRKKST